MKKHIVVIVAFMVQVAMAVNLQNITLVKGYKATVKSLAKLKEDIEADSLLDLKIKDDFLKDIKAGEDWAEELQPIDEECPAVETEKMISDECDEYFDDQLPKFMTAVRNFVMTYKHKHLEALKNSGKKRQFIKQCIEDVFSTNYNPQNFFVGASVELKEEIKKDGYQVNYSIGLLEPKENPVNNWLKGIADLCAQDIIVPKIKVSMSGHVDYMASYHVTELASDYAAEIVKKKNVVNRKYSFDFIEFKNERYCGPYENSCGNRLLVNYKNAESFSYSLNGKKVLHCEISGNADEIFFKSETMAGRRSPLDTAFFWMIGSNRYGKEVERELRPNLGCDCINGKFVGNKCKGSMLVTDEEFEKGFVGVFSWDKSSDNNSTKKKSAECDNPNLTPKEQKKCRVQKR